MTLEYRKSLFIDGAWTEAKAGQTIQVVDPASNEDLAQMAYGDREDANQALDAASLAFRDFSQTTARYRSNLLYRTAELLRARADQIGLLLARESGKRLEEGIGEVRFAAEYFQWFAEEARRPTGEVLANEDTRKRHSFVRQPAGVVLTLTPWNFPVSIQARKIAPALAAGCTVVARASEKAPLSVIELFRCLQDAGFPHGVVNLVHGPAGEVTRTMMQHPAVRVVSFTGSTGVGQKLIEQSADRVLRLALELGGNAPFIVFDDADVQKAVEALMIAKFRNNGQSCIAANRIYVHDRVFDQFSTALQAQVDNMRIGNPLDKLTDLGPLIDSTAQQELQAKIDAALRAGATRLTKDVEVPEIGNFLAPTFLTDVPLSEDFATSEIFGPASPVFRFSEEDEVIAAANETDMGLAAYAFTKDQSRSIRVTESLEYGIVAVNHPLPSVAFAPMGGWKLSGLGREGGQHGIEEFQEVKYVSVQV